LYFQSSRSTAPACAAASAGGFNSEWHLLLGYERELGRDFSAGLQYYLECLEDYRDHLPVDQQSREEDRHLLTLCLTKRALTQNLILSLFTYCAPSDQYYWLFFTAFVGLNLF